MRRLLAGVIVAFSMTVGLVVVAPVRAEAQDSACAVACRDAFVACSREARSGADAAACRVAAVACLAACVAD